MSKDFKYLLFISCITGTVLAADFGLTCGSEGGVRSDRFGNAGPADRTFFFITPSLAPFLTIAPWGRWSLELDGNASSNLYTEGSGDVSIESGVALIRHKRGKDLKARLSAGYYAQPGSLDPDQPEDYSQFSLLGEYRSKARNPLRLSYTLSVLDDAGASRIDMKHKAKGKITLKPGPSFMAGLGAGLGVNFSDTKGYRYFEADFPLSATYLINYDNFLTAMVYLNLRWYNGGGSDIKKITPDKAPKAAGSGSPSSRTAGLFLSYCRSLSGSLDLEANGDLSFFDSDFGVAYVSYKVYAGVEWRYGYL